LAAIERNALAIHVTAIIGTYCGDERLISSIWREAGWTDKKLALEIRCQTRKVGFVVVFCVRPLRRAVCPGVNAGFQITKRTGATDKFMLTNFRVRSQQAFIDR